MNFGREKKFEKSIDYNYKTKQYSPLVDEYHRRVVNH